MFQPTPSQKYIYHYTTLPTALEKILPHGTIRLSPFERTNDPRESKYWIFGMGGLFGEGKLNEFALKLSIRLKYSKVLCLTQDDFNTEQRYMYSCKGFARPRMWAQYAENHKGVCLIFDRDELEQSVDKQIGTQSIIFKGSVHYTDIPYGILDVVRLPDNYDSNLEIQINNHIQKYNTELYFTKNLDWKDEFEYRIVYLGKDESPMDVDFQNSLKGLVVGDDFPKVYYHVLDHFRDKYNFEVRHISWEMGIPSAMEIPNAVSRKSASSWLKAMANLKITKGSENRI
jgi:hypothetical protein